MTFPEPPSAPAPTTCFLHTNRETGRRCTRCGKYACPDCLTTASVGSHCWECLKAAQPPMSQQIKAKLAQPLLVTRIIIGLNLMVFAVQVANGESLGSFLGGGSRVTNFDINWGLVSQGIAAGQWYRMVTTGFLHFGALHILFNMLILFRLGQQLESGIGRMRFATIYAASLLGGSLATVLLNSQGVGGGASGAVFGMAGAATIALWQRGIGFYNTGWGPMLIINLVLTFTLPNVGVGAHLGGLLVGAILGYIMLRPGSSKRDAKLGYGVAAIIIVASFAISQPYAHHKFPTCQSAGLDLRCAVSDFGAVRSSSAGAAQRNTVAAHSASEGFEFERSRVGVVDKAVAALLGKIIAALPRPVR